MKIQLTIRNKIENTNCTSIEFDNSSLIFTPDGKFEDFHTCKFNSKQEVDKNIDLPRLSKLLNTDLYDMYKVSFDIPEFYNMFVGKY